MGDPLSREHATANQTGNVLARLKGFFVGVRISQDVVEDGGIERKQSRIPLRDGLKEGDVG